jgi:hypothetical protein
MQERENTRGETQKKIYLLFLDGRGRHPKKSESAEDQATRVLLP